MYYVQQQQPAYIVGLCGPGQGSPAETLEEAVEVYMRRAQGASQGTKTWILTPEGERIRPHGWRNGSVVTWASVR